MATRMQQRRGTAAQWTSANPVLGAGEIGFETDTGKFKFGDGVNEWGDLAYFLDATDLDLGGSLDDYVPLTQKGANNGVATLDSTGNVPINQLGNLIDGAPGTLNTLNELAAAVNDNPEFYSTVTSLAETVGDNSNDIGTLNTSVGNLNTTVSGHTTSISSLSTDVGNLQTDQGNLETAVDNLDSNKAPKDSPTFSGTVVLPSTTSIGDVSSTEIGYLNGVTSDLQTQIDGKLASSTASSTYAPLSGPTFTGTVTLPNTTSIGTVDSSEISYLNGVTSAIQTQLDAKAPTANPTFTGTVSGVTKAMVGLGNVDNTADADKPVSTATQTALNLKADLAGPTFTGTVTLPSTTSVGNVSSTELGYLDGVTSAIQTQLDAKAALAGPTFTGTVTLPSTTSIGTVSSTELGYLDGVTSALQTQLDGKAASSHTHAIGDVTNLQTSLNAKLDLAGGTMTGALILSGDPTQALGAVTKQYVDNISAGLHVHEAAHVATNNTLAVLCGSTVTYNNGTDGVGATLTLGASLSTIDGHTLTNGDRILVKNEATQAHNGIYVRTSGTVLTRATDFDSAAEIAGGDFVFVENGTVGNSTGWVVENEVNTIGTDAVQWLQFMGAGTITGGSNITVSGTQVSVSNSPSFTGTVTLPSTTSIGNVSSTELGYLDGVTSAIQTQINGKANTSHTHSQADITNLTTDLAAKANLAGPTFTGTVTLPSTTSIGDVSSTELGFLDGVTSAIQTQINAKANIAAPTFTGLVTLSASGVAFSDGTQTREGVPSRTPIIQQTAAYNLSTGGLSLRDNLIEISHTGGSPVQLTIPADSTTNFPIGTSIDVLRTNTGGVTIVGAGGVTVNGTPGLTLRAQWSSATLFKRAANTWIVMGDLTA